MRSRHADKWSFSTNTRSRPNALSKGVPVPVLMFARQLRETVKGFEATGPSSCEGACAEFGVVEEMLAQDASRAHINRKVELLNDLEQVYLDSQMDGWDGDGSIGVSCETYAMARRFLKSIPQDLAHPSITPEFDGRMSFEWYRTTRHILTVSIDRNGSLYWAALIESEDPRGSCKFTTEFPATLSYLIQRIV